MGDSGYFSEKNLVKAIYTAWNIEAELYLLNDRFKKINWFETFLKQCKLIFSSMDDNKFNSDILKEFGYRMEDGKEFREIIEIKTGKVVKYDWKDVKQLV
jgi:hypothetical protein